MSHKEALRVALVAYWGEIFGPHAPGDFINTQDMESAIRAYLEALGLVMVPKEPTQEMVAEGADTAIGTHYCGSFGARAVYASMLAAAPDPFEEAKP